MWADLMYLLYVVFGSICKTFASLGHILWPSSYAFGLILISQAGPVSGYICVP
jgi:hypothetical protein